MKLKIALCGLIAGHSAKRAIRFMAIATCALTGLLAGLSPVMAETHTYQLVDVTGTGGAAQLSGRFTYNDVTGQVETASFTTTADPAVGLVADTFDLVLGTLTYGPSHQLVVRSTTSSPPNDIAINFGAFLGTQPEYVFTQAPSPGGATYIFVNLDIDEYLLVNGKAVEVNTNELVINVTGVPGSGETTWSFSGEYTAPANNIAANGKWYKIGDFTAFHDNQNRPFLSGGTAQVVGSSTGPETITGVYLDDDGVSDDFGWNTYNGKEYEVGETLTFSGSSVLGFDMNTFEILSFPTTFTGTTQNGAVLQLTFSLPPPEPVLQLKAADYNPTTGVWTDSSGQNNDATQTIAHMAWWPSLETNVTANGSSVVRFDGDDRLDLSQLIQPGLAADGFTFFVYTRPTAAGLVGTQNLISGQVGSPHYLLIDGKPQINKQLNFPLGSADTALSSVDFSCVNVKVNNTAASFRLNGFPDGSVVNARTFANAIYYIGANSRGDIAEIRIYNSQLTAAEIAAVEAELKTAYELPLNSPPTANAGADQSIRAGDIVELDGSASFDDNTSEALLDYQWSVDSAPVGSVATLIDPDSVFASFVADVPGTYSLKLTVTDEELASSEDYVEINTIDSFTVDVQTGIELLLLDPLLTDKAGDKLTDAFDKLADAQEELAQGGDVEKGLKKISDAVKKLLDAQDEGADVADLIVQLVDSAFGIAQDTIDAAIAANGDMDDIADAMEEMVKAQEDLDDGKPEKAIDHYAKAWDDVQP